MDSAASRLPQRAPVPVWAPREERSEPVEPASGVAEATPEPGAWPARFAPAVPLGSPARGGPEKHPRPQPVGRQAVNQEWWDAAAQQGEAAPRM